MTFFEKREIYEVNVCAWGAFLIVIKCPVLKKREFLLHKRFAKGAFLIEVRALFWKNFNFANLNVGKV